MYAWEQNRLPLIDDQSKMIELDNQDGRYIRCIFVSNEVRQDTDALFQLTNDGEKILITGDSARGMYTNDAITGVDYISTEAQEKFFEFFKVGTSNNWNYFTVQERSKTLHPLVTEITHSKTLQPDTYYDLDNVKLYNIPFTRFLRIVKEKNGRFKMIYSDNINEQAVLFDDISYNMVLSNTDGKVKYNLNELFVNNNDGTGGRMYVYLNNGRGIRIFNSRTDDKEYSIENNLQLRLAKRAPPKEIIVWDNLPEDCKARAITRDFTERNRFGGSSKKFPSNHIYPFLTMAQDKIKSNPDKPLGILLMYKDTKVGVFFKNNIWYYTTKGGISSMFIQEEVPSDDKLLEFTKVLMKELGTYKGKHTSWNTVQGIVYANHNEDGVHVTSRDVYAAQQEFQGNTRFNGRYELEECANDTIHTFKAEMFRHQVGEMRLYRCPAETLTKTESLQDADDNRTTLPRQIIRDLGLQNRYIRRRRGDAPTSYTTSVCWFCGTDPCVKRNVKQNLIDEGIL